MNFGFRWFDDARWCAGRIGRPLLTVCPAVGPVVVDAYGVIAGPKQYAKRFTDHRNHSLGYVDIGGEG